MFTLHKYYIHLQVLWTHHLSSDYALFIALAIIDIEKEKLQDSDFDFSDIIAVRYIIINAYASSARNSF